MVVARGWKEEEMQVVEWVRVPVFQDEKVLEIHGGNDCTTM